MGNHKFRLSNIIPNGWFYKLKEMGITPKSTPSPTLPTTTTIDEDAVQAPVTRRNSPPLPRKSYHFSRKRSPTTKKTTISTPTPTPSSTTTKSSSSSSVSAACSCRSTATATVQSALRSKPSSSPLQESASSLHSFDQMVAWSSTSCHCSSNSPVPYDDDDDDEDDVVIGVDKISLRCKTDENVEPRVGLPPIRTEHKKFSDLVREIGEAEEQLLLVDKAIKHRKSSVKYRQDHVISRSPVRRIPSGYRSPRVRLRIHSPKLSRRVENGAGRKSASRSGRRKKRTATDGMAVVKSSSDPERDFRESMMEMIVENEIREAKGLEELLACYLSLNSMEYHHLIVHVFQQIWFDLNHITL